MSRWVIFGGGGFVGRALTPMLREAGIDSIAPSSKELDLAADNAAQQIADMVHDGDSILMLSALTPEKGPAADMTLRNVQMIRNLLAGIASKQTDHFIYISSDAVYPLSADAVSEKTPTTPDSLYGQMHVMREQFVREAIPADKLTILRPCAIYGAGDSHFAYGITRFIRSAMEQGEITLFGGGEEYRDHLHVEDFAAIIRDAMVRRVTGLYNLASGRSWRFRELAEMVRDALSTQVKIIEKPRAQPITHRHVNMVHAWSHFPAHKPRSVDAGLQQLVQQLVQKQAA